MASKPRTTRMSVILPRKCDEATLKWLGNVFREHNEKEFELTESRGCMESRCASLYISEVRCAPADEDTTQCLMYTNGPQFQSTRWFKMLRAVLGIVETMGQEDKSKQIAKFTSSMRHLDDESVLKFTVPSSQKKRALDTGAAADQPPPKQLALSEKSYPPVPTRVNGSSSTMLQQTVLTGVSPPPSAKQIEPVLSQHRSSEGAPSLSLEGLFAPQSDAVGKLCDFLTGKQPPFKAPKIVDSRRDGESAEAYRARVRKALNQQPVIVRVISKLLPPALTASSRVLQSLLSTEDSNALLRLQRMFQMSSWRGVFILYPMSDSQELTYGVDCAPDDEASKRSCYLELWRRALKLEGALAQLAVYLMRIVECVAPPTLTTVSPRTLGNVRALLSGGAGLYGGGSSFWTKRSADCLQKLPDVGNPSVVKIIESLVRTRGDAFRAFYPFTDELSLLPALAQVVSLRGALCGISDRAMAKEVESNLDVERESKLALYSACCQSMCLYGGELTWLLREVHVWCGEFPSIAKDLKLEKPTGINVLSLSQDGSVIGLDGQPLPLGHVDADWKGGLLPFPDYCMAVVPQPVDKVEEMLKQRREYEDSLLREMVVSPGVKEALAEMGVQEGAYAELCAVKCMRRGADTIAAWFRDDCHKKMLTCYLPATASMPEAVYSPDEIYRVK